MKWVFCFFLAAVSQCSESAKILFFAPMPGRSHHFVFQTVIKALADRGHQIDYLTAIPIKNPPPNVKHLIIKDKLDEALSKLLNESKLNELRYLASDIALVLVNSHVAVSYAVPRAPHVKEIGGMTLTGATELPQDLQSFLDRAKEGFVYFSLGSNVDMRIMTRDGKLQEFLEAFSALKQKVLFKWTGPDLPKTDNQKILIRSWFPQLGILNHKNINAFVTHGGMQSTFETVNYGVPVVGIPIFADQPKNRRFLVTKGCGVEIDKFNITKDSLFWAINEAVSNPSYKEAVMKRSAILKDAPMKYIDQAVYWIEYVHKHGKVLQPASVHMPFYQVYLLDIAAVLGLALAISLYLTVLSLKAVWSIVFSRSAAIKTAKNKKD